MRLNYQTKNVERVENINVIVDEASLSDYYNRSLNYNEISDRLDGICDLTSDCSWGYYDCAFRKMVQYGLGCAGTFGIGCYAFLRDYFQWVFVDCTRDYCNSDCHQ